MLEDRMLALLVSKRLHPAANRNMQKPTGSHIRGAWESCGREGGRNEGPEVNRDQQSEIT